MIKLYENKELCYGCTACISVCPQNAIKMIPDEEGFFYPYIAEKICISCGACVGICDKIKATKKNGRSIAYAFQCNNTNIRRKSSSGGAFYLLATSMINKGGMVCGAVLDCQSFNVKHIISNNPSDIERMMGSKYVQSDMGNCLNEVKKYVLNGYQVLFSGTGCQVAACRNVVGENDLLLTCEVLCHGTPSPLIWKQYINSVIEQYSSNIRDISFRSKNKGWHNFGMEIQFENGTKQQETLDDNPFLCGFLRNLYLRPTCYDCKYASQERCSDICIGDFWGYNEAFSDIIDDDTGISALIVSTEKGKLALRDILKKAKIYPVSIQNMIPNNGPLRKSVDWPDNRNNFWMDFGSNNFDFVKKKYMYPKKYSFLQRLRKSRVGQLLRRIRNIIRGR